VNSIPIRLTEERWFHIVENHNDLAGYYEDILAAVESPDMVVQGYGKAMIALSRRNKEPCLAVVCKELSTSDGFIITAYFTSRAKIEKEAVIWQKQP